MNVDGAASATPPRRREVVPFDRPTGPVIFNAIADLDQKGDAVKLQLRNAVVADSKDWPASFRATFDTARGESSCTAVLIGPQAMLTAAHCVPADGKISYGRLGTQPQSADCSINGDWTSGADDSADFALCRLRTPFKEPPNFKYESVNWTKIDPKPGDPVPVVLTGYGCTDDSAIKQKIDGKYRVGLTALVESSDSPAMSMGEDFYSPNQRYNLFTEDKGPNLCPGDSGGPAFQPTSTFNQSQVEHRSVIGINSRVFYANGSQTRYGASAISSVGAGRFKAWAKTWLGSLPACGLQGSIPNCRS